MEETNLLYKNKTILHINKKTFISSFYLEIVSACILIFFAFYNIFDYIPLFIIGIGLLLISSFLFSAKSFLIIMIILVPSIGMIKHINYSIALLGYVFLLSEIKYLFSSFKNIRLNTPILGLIVCVFITVAFYLDISLLTSFIRTAIFLVFILMFLQNSNFDNLFKKKIMISFIFGVVLNIILGILYYLVQSKFMYSGDFSGIRNDRNYYASLIAIAISISILNMINSNKKIFWSLLLVFLLFGGLLSGSRTFLISLVWSILLLFLLLFSRNYKKILLLIFIFSILSIVFWDYIEPPLKIIINRFKLDDVKTANDRFLAWSYYMKMTFSSPFSFLFGNSSKIGYGSSTYTIVQHNLFVESISEIGFLGSLLLFYSYFSLFKKMRKHKIKSLYGYFPLLVTLTCFFFINALFSDSFNIILLICFTTINYFYRFFGGENANCSNKYN